MDLRGAWCVLVALGIGACFSPSLVGRVCIEQSDCVDGFKCQRGRCVESTLDAGLRVDAGRDVAASPDAGPRSDGGVPPVSDGGPATDAADAAVPPVDAAGCVDLDGDGRGLGCALGDDCNDSEPSIFTIFVGVVDGDGDGVFSLTTESRCIDPDSPPADFSLDTPLIVDCNDDDAALFPGNTERCDGIDNDCDNVADEEGCACASFAIGGVPFLSCGEPVIAEDMPQACADFGFDPISFRDDAEYAQLGSSAFGRMWVGADDRATEGVFFWSDGRRVEPIFDTFFAEGEPNNVLNEDCLERVANNEWNDAECAITQAYGCRGTSVLGPCVDSDGDGFGLGCAAGFDCDDSDPARTGWTAVYDDLDGDGFTLGVPRIDCFAAPTTQALAPSASLDCDDNAIDATTTCDCFARGFAGKRYLFCPASGETWNDARDECLNLGGDLVVIDSVAEHLFATRTAHAIATGTYYWLGFNRLDEDDPFLWVDSTPLALDRFARTQPNNENANVACGALFVGGGWFDVANCVANPNLFDDIGHICELP